MSATSEDKIDNKPRTSATENETVSVSAVSQEDRQNRKRPSQSLEEKSKVK